MYPFDDFDFDDLEISQEDIFESLSDAEKVVERAKQELYDLLKEDIKSILREAAAARKELADLNNKVAQARYEAGTWEKKIEAEKERFERAKDFDIPKMYLDRIVRHMTGGYAPGDKVYVIEQETERATCPLCNGKKEVEAVIHGEHLTVRCPKCNGYGNISIKKQKKAVPKTVNEIHVRLCFEKNRVCAWNFENVYIGEREFSTSPDEIYPTEEAALAAIEEEQDG